MNIKNAITWSKKHWKDITVGCIGAVGAVLLKKNYEYRIPINPCYNHHICISSSEKRFIDDLNEFTKNGPFINSSAMNVDSNAIMEFVKTHASEEASYSILLRKNLK